MITNILAVVEPAVESAKDINSLRGIIMVIVGLFLYVGFFGLIISCLIRISRFFRTAGKEQKLIRMELGKVAEEVHLLRQEMKVSKDSSPPMVG